MNRFVIADPKKCIGCRTCEIACVLSHQDNKVVNFEPDKFHPRLQVIKGAKVTTPIMCRQCDDAPCAQVCPNGAIRSEGGYVEVLQERCIGCKTCELACPYGAMNVISQEVAEKWGNPLFDKPQAKAFALKCDLCGGCEDGQACVNVCPTKALKLVDPKTRQQVSNQKRMAAATSGAELVLV
ncbi:4Fe-4S binding protein [Ferrimonas balearica]|uniref:4Fe-4S binding protein n=1 Tax=Ferrimonas balearica TaxID=44012 RepID=UPI001C98C696|nr:4Fe-4S binding protein [Ferrimonas balearica]MBY5979439.1 4Fe-4S dicluster domain-containing protein [Ferrimonas balearica]